MEKPAYDAPAGIVTVVRPMSRFPSQTSTMIVMSSDSVFVSWTCPPRTARESEVTFVRVNVATVLFLLP